MLLPNFLLGDKLVPFLFQEKCTSFHISNLLIEFIQDIENTIITILSRYTIHAKADLSARGVYVDDSKIASIGLRSTSRGTYHGFALNVSTDIRPFTWINPCGKPQKMVNIHMLSSISVDDIIVRCLQAIKDSALLDSRPCRILSDTSYLNEYA